MPKPLNRMTAAQFEAAFPNEKACISYLIARRWPNGVRCPRCSNPRVYALPSGHHWQCHKCTPRGGYRFSHLVGTIFEDTNKPLKDWFHVVHKIVTRKTGVSAMQIQSELGFGSFVAAWNMCQRVRTALMKRAVDKLGGIVEFDETRVGKPITKRRGSGGGRGTSHGKTIPMEVDWRRNPRLPIAGQTLVIDAADARSIIFHIERAKHRRRPK